MSEFEKGTIIDEKYELIREIGAGGAGIVFEGRHIDLERRVAIKVMRAKNPALDDYQLRFRREAKIMTRLEHPNAVKVFDFGRHNGSPYLVMEFLEGSSFEDELSRGVPTMERTIDITTQTADVLAAAHALGLVHRDVKPDNIFITESDDGPHAILVDFGLAFIDADEQLARMTKDGSISGTPQFLSPEQALGAKDIGPATDIYSLGCVVYEALSGVPAVQGESVIKLLNAHIFVPVTSLRSQSPDAGFPAALDTFVLAMLSKDPDSRPSAFEVAAFFRNLAGSTDLRGRGRPEKMLEPRASRAVTVTPMHGTQFRANHPTPAAPATVRDRLAIDQPVDPDMFAAADAAGLRLVAPDAEDFEAIVVFDPARVDAELTQKGAVIVCVDSSDLDSVVELMKLGVDDVLHDPSPDEIIRKALRAIRSRARRGGSK